MNSSSAIWKWMEEAKAAGTTTSSRSDDVEVFVRGLPGALQTKVTDEYADLQRQADQLILWEACSLLLGGTSGDDSFEYFRNWLIWGGPNFFADAIRTPDELIALSEREKLDISSPFFESLSVLGTDAGLANLGADRVQPITFAQFSPRNWNWLDSSTKRIEQDLPKLWSRYGGQFSWDPPAPPFASSFEAPGLGTLHVGDRVRHKFGYREGVVTEVLVADTSLATIKFSDESRPFRITSEHFELVA